MHSTQAGPDRRLPRRLLATAAALLGAWLAVGELARWRRVQVGLEARAAATGLLAQQPDLRRDLRRTVDPVRAELRLGLALLAQELDRRWLQTLDADERAAQDRLGLERLDAATALAAPALARRPGSWEAALVLGGSNFLAFSRRNDPRLRTRPELSEGLLLRARQLAPGRPEPARLLAAFYLGNWSRLGDGEQAQAMGIIAAALENPISFALLIEHWLRVAPSLDAALSVVPDQPETWRRLQDLFARRGDIERYRDATERWSDAVARAAPERTARAARQISRGGLREGRRAVLAVLSQLTPSVGRSDAFATALRALPPGPLGEREVEQLRRWLAWSLDLCLHTACPLDPDSLQRLVRLVPELEPATRAAAAVAAGDLAGAERLEREATSGSDPDWDAYWLLKTRELAARGRGDDGAAAFGRLSEARRDSIPALAARVAVAAAQGDASGLATAREALAGRAAAGWPHTDWTRTDWEARISVLASGTGRLVTQFTTPPAGAVVEALVDGESLGYFSLLPGESWETGEAVTSGPHLLHLRLLTSRDVAPGAVRLATEPG